MQSKKHRFVLLCLALAMLGCICLSPSKSERASALAMQTRLAEEEPYVPVAYEGVGQFVADPPQKIPLVGLVDAIGQLGPYREGDILDVLHMKLPKELWPAVCWPAEGEMAPELPLPGGVGECWEWGIRLVSHKISTHSGMEMMLHHVLLTQEIPTTNCYYLYDVLFSALSGQPEDFRFAPVCAGELATYMIDKSQWNLYFRADVDIADSTAEISVQSNLVGSPTSIGELRLRIGPVSPGERGVQVQRIEEVDGGLRVVYGAPGVSDAMGSFSRTDSLYDFGLLTLPQGSCW